MALSLPVLDDRDYEQLRRQLVSELPRVAADYTDHNPADPGIAVLELLAAMAEMILYRMDQIPEPVSRNFLRMVVERPEPVTVDLRFTRQAPATGLLTVPAGTRVGGPATSEVFETVREGRFLPGELTITVPARHLEEVLPAGDLGDLGASDGSADQSFELLPLTATAAGTRPILLDPARQGSALYNPNPEVEVGGRRWRYAQDLLEVGEEPVFTVEWLSYRLRFGDGVRGVIPPTGEPIHCRRFQVVRGKEVQVAAGTLTEVRQTRAPLAVLPAAATPLLPPHLNHDAIRGLLIADGLLTATQRDALLAIPSPPVDYRQAVETLFAASNLAVVNPEDASGGRFLFDLNSAADAGLRVLTQVERAITPEDFERLADAFNEQNGVAGTPRIRRLLARRLDDLGTLAVMVIPDDPANRWPVPTAALKRTVYRFLDRRRPITTRLLIGDPQYRSIRVQARIVARRNTDTAALQRRAADTLNQFFDPLAGFTGAGWPLGRSVYRSEVFEQLSRLDDVAYIEAALLDGGAEDYVELRPLELPRILVAAADLTFPGART